jgi:hypothetical protein
MKSEDSLEPFLQKKRVIHNEIKRRSHIFDCDGKERLADWYGLPINCFYDLSYQDYIKSKDAMLQEIEVMGSYCDEISLQLQKDFYKTPYKLWVDIFRQYTKAAFLICSI